MSSFLKGTKNSLALLFFPLLVIGFQFDLLLYVLELNRLKATKSPMTYGKPKSIRLPLPTAGGPPWPLRQM